MSNIRLGVLLGSGAVQPSQIAAVAAQAEASGFDELWASEDYFFTGGVSTAAIALSATNSITVGIGVLPMFTRHPALTAMESATLAAAFPGRFILGIGTGVEKWLQQMNVKHGPPLRATREYVAALKDLGAGRTVDASDGEFIFQDVALHSPHEIPVYIGSIGPRMLRQAGKIADGVVLSVMSSPQYIRIAAAQIAEEAPSGPAKPVVAFSMYACDEDGAVARFRARQQLGSYLSRISPMTDALGISEDVLDRRQRMTNDEFIDAMPEEWVRTMTVSGTPCECLTAVEELHEAGATSVVLYLAPSDNPVEQIRAAGQALITRR